MAFVEREGRVPAVGFLADFDARTVTAVVDFAAAAVVLAAVLPTLPFAPVLGLSPACEVRFTGVDLSGLRAVRC